LADFKFQEISGHYKNFVCMAAMDFEFLLNRIAPYFGFFGSHSTVLLYTLQLILLSYHLSTPFSQTQHKLSHTILTALTEQGRMLQQHHPY
jgi:hypothetical protein